MCIKFPAMLPPDSFRNGDKTSEEFAQLLPIFKKSKNLISCLELLENQEDVPVSLVHKVFHCSANESSGSLELLHQLGFINYPRDTGPIEKRVSLLVRGRQFLEYWRTKSQSEREIHMKRPPKEQTLMSIESLRAKVRDIICPVMQSLCKYLSPEEFDEVLELMTDDTIDSLLTAYGHRARLAVFESQVINDVFYIDLNKILKVFRKRKENESSSGKPPSKTRTKKKK